MWKYVLNTPTNVFCQYCPRREGFRRGAVLRSICQACWPSTAPHWTGRAQVKERIMFSKLILLFVCFRCTHGWMGMDVLVNVFTMPFLCSDSGPWRKTSRAWPPMSAITTSSGSTCPSHQESAWVAAEARQERVIVQVVRKAVIAGFV